MDLGPRRRRERLRRLERSRGGEGEGGPGGSRGKSGVRSRGVRPRSFDFPFELFSSRLRASIIASIELFMTLRESSRDSILVVLSCDMTVMSGAVERGGIGVIDDMPGISEGPGIGDVTTVCEDGILEIVSREVRTSGCCGSSGDPGVDLVLSVLRCFRRLSTGLE